MIRGGSRNFDYDKLVTMGNIDKKTQRRKTDLVPSVCQAIERQILDGILRPNQPLIESELCNKLGVSRTPLREALNQLEVRGFVNKRRSVGYAVALLTGKDLQEIFQIRLALEPSIMELACDNATDKQIERATEFLANYDTASYDTPPRIMDAIKWNHRFHSELYNASGNKRMAAMVQSVRDTTRLISLGRNMISEEQVTNSRQHAAILEAVKNRDKVKARLAVIEHLESGHNMYLKYL
jgi:DNA-binding GntR family transcriptional regulator